MNDTSSQLRLFLKKGVPLLTSGKVGGKEKASRTVSSEAPGAKALMVKTTAV
jgi:hypothetical protein